CKLKLERLTHQAAGQAEDQDDDPPDEDDLFSGLADHRSGQDDRGQREAVYAAMTSDLAHGRWDGDRDTLAIPPDPLTWQTVAADVSSCSARHCPAYGECSYFLQRKALVGAQVIVVNHDLLLSSLGSRALPDLDNCLLVLDE
ncbi:hypothetical protein RZS08_19035, partial [Arthrospira platensis SPKY1]|nr:hypothetical protein [Arthrospira platensis SPKY1]